MSPPNPASPIGLDVVPDRALAWNGGGSYRYGVVTLTGTQASLTHDRTARAIAVVVDAASAEARQLAPPIIDVLLGYLSAGDVVALVSCGDAGVVHLAPTEMTEAGKALLRARLNSLPEGTGQNLVDGWLTAATCVAPYANKGRRPVAVVLSSGSITSGLSDIAEIADIALGMRSRGLMTRCLGLGPRVDEASLAALEGYLPKQRTIRSAANVPDIARMLAAELGLMAPAAEDVIVRFTLPTGLEADGLGSDPIPPTPRQLVINVGTIQMSEVRYLVARFRFPEGVSPPQHIMKIAVSVRGRSATGGREAFDVRSHIEFRLVPGSRNNVQRRNEDASLVVAGAWLSEIIDEGICSVRSGTWKEFDRYLAKQRPLFGRYVVGLPGGPSLTDRLDTSIETIRRRSAEMPG
jgi:hypothetical protein